MIMKPVLALCAGLLMFLGVFWPAPHVGYLSLPSTQSVRPPTASTSAVSAKLRKPHLPLRRHAVVAPPRAVSPKALSPRAIGPRIDVLNGLNKPGLNAADNGLNQTSPPDATGSIGPNHYVEMINTVIGVYNRSDLSLVSKTSFNTWLNTTAPLCDPQIQWDNSAQRWLYVVLGCNFGVDTLFFGWSKNTDPSN